MPILPETINAAKSIPLQSIAERQWYLRRLLLALRTSMIFVCAEGSASIAVGNDLRKKTRTVDRREAEASLLPALSNMYGQ